MFLSSSNRGFNTEVHLETRWNNTQTDTSHMPTNRKHWLFTQILRSCTGDLWEGVWSWSRQVYHLGVRRIHLQQQWNTDRTSSVKLRRRAHKAKVSWEVVQVKIAPQRVKAAGEALITDCCMEENKTLQCAEYNHLLTWAICVNLTKKEETQPLYFSRRLGCRITEAAWLPVPGV